MVSRYLFNKVPLYYRFSAFIKALVMFWISSYVHTTSHQFCSWLTQCGQLHHCLYKSFSHVLNMFTLPVINSAVDLQCGQLHHCLYKSFSHVLNMFTLPVINSAVDLHSVDSSIIAFIKALAHVLDMFTLPVINSAVDLQCGQLHHCLYKSFSHVLNMFTLPVINSAVDLHSVDSSIIAFMKALVIFWICSHYQSSILQLTYTVWTATSLPL